MTNETKQTAVEWLGYELNTKLFYDISPELWEQVNDIFKKAKEMEKQQIIDAIIRTEKQYHINAEVWPTQFIVDKAERIYKEQY